MLKVIFHPTDRFEVYIDIRDSNSYHKAQKLREVCSNSMCKCFYPGKSCTQNKIKQKKTISGF